MRYLGSALCLLLCAPAFSQETMFARYRPAAQRVADAVNAGEGADLQKDLSEDARKELTPEKLASTFKDLVKDLGRLTTLGAAELAPPYIVYPAKFQRGSAQLKLSFDKDDKITGLLLIPVERSAAAPVEAKPYLSLPFRGRWLVFWGGDTLELNAHHGARNQRYAFDFVGVDAKGSTHTGDGKTNADYHAFGREILAPADGQVTQAIDGVDDNSPGSMNPYFALGNAVVLKHRDGEVSVLAHLKRGSLRVKAGALVKKGQIIALCGNSGNSSEPHLHYHLQDSTVVPDGGGVKAVFDRVSVVREGAPQKLQGYSPVKGDVLVVEKPAP